MRGGEEALQQQRNKQQTNTTHDHNTISGSQRFRANKLNLNKQDTLDNITMTFFDLK